MIGLKAILYTLLPVLAVIVFGFIVVYILRSREQWWKQGTPLAIIALFLFISAAFLTGTVAGLRGYFFLKNLRPENAASITVGNETITDRAALDALAGSLRTVAWFVSDHDGWAKEVPLHIRLRTGEERQFTVALYLKQHGAVIRGVLGGGNFHYSYECGFHSDLPDVLARLNAPLPTTK